MLWCDYLTIDYIMVLMIIMIGREKYQIKVHMWKWDSDMINFTEQNFFPIPIILLLPSHLLH